jgi:hypothetical protein
MKKLRFHEESGRKRIRSSKFCIDSDSDIVDDTTNSLDDHSVSPELTTDWSSDDEELTITDFSVYSDTANGFKDTLYASEEQKCQVCLVGENVVGRKWDSPELTVLQVTSDSHRDMPFALAGGVKFHIHGDSIDGVISICAECLVTLRANRIPKLSILNYMWVDKVPDELKNLTVAEELLCSRIIRRSIVWKSTWAHSKLNHHVVGFDNHLETVQILPIPISRLGDLLQVVMVNAHPNTQFLQKINTVRKSNCLAAVRWLKDNHSGYNDVEIDDSFMSSDVFTQEVEEQEGIDIERFIPSHAEFGIEHDKLHLKVSKGHVIEHFSKSGLFESPINSKTTESIAIEGSLNTFLGHVNNGLVGHLISKDLCDLNSEMSWIPRAYPTLFPRGLTGPKNGIRGIEPSFNEWVKWTLLTHEDAQTHPDFILAVYNLLQRHNAIRITRYFGFFESFLTFRLFRMKVAGFPSTKLTAADLIEQLQRVKSRKRIDHVGVTQLLKQTRVVGSMLPHSPQRKVIIRSNITGLMIRYGSPAFFVTLNPNDLYSPIIALKRSKWNALEKAAFFSNGAVDFDFSLNQNPIQCSTYFHDVVKAFFKHGLGYDSSSMSYSPSIFGKVVAHLGVIEEQQRKQLHIHMLVWVEGLTDYAIFNENMQDNEYEAKIINYLHRLMTSKKRHCDLESTFQKDARLYLCPDGNNFDNQLGWVQKWAQMHKCSKFHCQKKGKKCRYKFPRAIVEKSHYNRETLTFLHERNDQYVNACVPFVAVVGRFNTDIQFLPGKGCASKARSAAFYISDYSSKSDASYMHLLDFMVSKIPQLQQHNPKVLEKPTGLFQSMLMKTVSKFASARDVGAVEAASLLLGYPDHYGSKYFEPLDWKAWDLWLCRELNDM